MLTREEFIKSLHRATAKNKVEWKLEGMLSDRYFTCEFGPYWLRITRSIQVGGTVHVLECRARKQEDCVALGQSLHFHLQLEELYDLICEKVTVKTVLFKDIFAELNKRLATEEQG